MGKCHSPMFAEAVVCTTDNSAHCSEVWPVICPVTTAPVPTLSGPMKIQCYLTLPVLSLSDLLPLQAVFLLSSDPHICVGGHSAHGCRGRTGEAL